MNKQQPTFTLLPYTTLFRSPLTQALDDRELREELFKASWSRTEKGEYSTLDMIKEIVQLRNDKAKLLGYDNYAAWNLQDTMVKNTETVFDFFGSLVQPTVEAANREALALQQMINASGEDFELAPWDWSYYAEKLRKEKYDLDENEIKPYFVLENVLEDGVFYSATKLFGITFKKRTDIPTYHPDEIGRASCRESG